MVRPVSKTSIEQLLERGIFASRWILAPFYVGLVAILVMLLIAFGRELMQGVPHALELHTDEIIMISLSLIDLSLTANLVLIIVFSGYENFVSKIDTGESEDRPSWMGTLDFSGLKMKLIGSIVAISAISLLRSFMTLNDQGHAVDYDRLKWLLVLHLAFVGSGVLFALMDWLACLSHMLADRQTHGRIGRPIH